MDGVGTLTRLLMVGCGWMGRPYLKRAHARGMQVAVLDSAAAFGWPETRAALGEQDQTYVADGTDEEAWIVAASAALRDGPVDGVLAFSEQHVLAAALLADELGLPGPGLRAARTSRNKLIQRETFARHGLAQPEYLPARTADAAIEWAKDRYPVVLKPLSSTGSHGVRIVTDETEVADWVREREDSGVFLVERYLPGPEYSVEAVIERGTVVFRIVTDKTTTPAPYCVELEHQSPADLGGSERTSIEELLDGVVSALAIGSGIVHLELRLEADGPHIMEVAVRTPGDYIMDVVEAATGVDLYDAVIAVACGQPPPVEPTVDGVACVWFPTAEPGVITAIEGTERVAQLEGVVNIEIDVEPGGRVEPLRSSMERLGMVILGATDRGELGKRLDAVRAELLIAVQPAHG